MYDSRMENLTPQAVRDSATAALKPLSQLLQEVGVPSSTFYRWEQGKLKGDIHPITRRRLQMAIDAGGQ